MNIGHGVVLPRRCFDLYNPVSCHLVGVTIVEKSCWGGHRTFAAGSVSAGESGGGVCEASGEGVCPRPDHAQRARAAISFFPEASAGGPGRSGRTQPHGLRLRHPLEPRRRSEARHVVQGKKCCIVLFVCRVCHFGPRL